MKRRGVRDILTNNKFELQFSQALNLEMDN